MASETITVKSSGDVAAAMDAVVSETMGRASRLDFRNVLREIVLRRLQIWHAGYFAKETDPGGRPWAPLHPITVKKKGHDTILVDTEALLRSLVGRNKHSIARVHGGLGKAELRYGTRRPDAWRHQAGIGRPGQNLPQRKMVGINQRRVSQVVKVIADDAVRQLAGMKPAKVAANVVRRSA